MQYPRLNQLQSYGAVKERKIMLVLFLKPVSDGMQKARVQGRGIKQMPVCTVAAILLYTPHSACTLLKVQFQMTSSHFSLLAATFSLIISSVSANCFNYLLV